MKLKEYPVSLYQSLKLLLTPTARLGRHARPAGVPLVVSLTSIPSRLPILHLTIRSLLRQSVRPDKLLLWLHHDLREQTPRRLTALQNGVFEIRYADQTCAHRKLVHALGAYPAHVIVTCDDDLQYRPHWLERLVAEHRAHPGAIIGHECRRIAFDGQGKAAPYRDWRSESPGASHRYTLPIGYGGTLYPPGSLHPDVTDAERYLELAPRADDLWFKAMSLRQGTTTRRSARPPAKPVPIIRSQAERLGDTNIKADGNRAQWQALLDAYPELAPRELDETGK